MEERINNNYLKGTLGALIGSLIASIPWILMYVYGEMIMSLLALIIAAVAYKFYKLFGGVVTKKTPIIIVFTSILAITISTFVIIPLLLVVKEGYSLSFEWFKYLYTNGEFTRAIIADYLLSLLFAVLGISGIIKNIKEEAYLKENRGSLENAPMTYEEEIKYAESIYEKYGAFTKESAILNSLVLKEFNINNVLYTKLNKEGIIVTVKNKSYFDKEAIENSEKRRLNQKKNKQTSIRVATILVIIIVAFFTFIIALTSYEDDDYTKEPSTNNKTELKTYTYKDIEIKLSNDFRETKKENYNYYDNYGIGIVKEIVLEEYELYDSIQSEYEYFKGEYLDSFKDEFEIISHGDYKKDNLLGYKVILKSKERSDEYNLIYASFGSNTYLITYYTELKNATEKDIQNFVNKSEEYQKNITFTKENLPNSSI